MEQGKRNRATTIVVLGILGLTMSFSEGCGGYVGNGGGGGNNNSYSITGTVVDSATTKPVAGAQVVLEQPDGNGIDRVILSTTTASDGTFTFSPSAGIYDLVADATVTAASVPTVTYAATVNFGVPANANVNQIPLVPEFGSATPNGNPATISATVNASGGTMAFLGQVDVNLSALQSVSPAVGTVNQITIPTFSGSTSTLTTVTGSSCANGTTCLAYSLIVPSGNFSFGRFSASGTQYTLALLQPTNVNYTVEGRASFHRAALTPDCTPPTITTPIVIVSGTPTFTDPNLNFTGCL